jgi:hypothetical protein
MSSQRTRRPAWWPTEVEVELLRGACSDDDALALAAGARLGSSGESPALRGDAARLGPLLYERLCAAGRSGPDLLPLRRAYAAVRGVNARTRKHAGEALQRLAARGIVPMLLKGLALDQLAGEQGSRRIGDLDVMVRHQQLADAIEALVAGGWAAIDVTTPGTLDAKHSTCLQRLDTAEVDLHWVLGGRLAVARDPDAAMAPFWLRARAASYRGVPVVLLHPMHQVLHLAVHGALVESRAAARWLADVAFVLRRAGAEGALEWPVLTDAARALRVSLQLTEALRCFDHVFPGVVPAEVLAELQSTRRKPAERLLWLLDSRTVRRPLLLDVVRTLRQHLSYQRFRSLPSALALYPRYLAQNGYLVSPAQLARHVARRRRERRAAAADRKA